MPNRKAAWFYWQQTSLYIHIYLQPGASTDKIVGLHDDCLKIRLTAPPTEGRANKYLVTFLAHCFDVSEQQVTITAGQQSRKKWVKITKPHNLSILDESSHSQ